MSEVKENFIQLENIDTFKISKIEKDRITLTFGRAERENGKITQVQVVSSLNFNTKLLKNLVAQLMVQGMIYQDKTGKDIGFPKIKNKINEKDGE